MCAILTRIILLRLVGNGQSGAVAFPLSCLQVEKDSLHGLVRGCDSMCRASDRKDAVGFPLEQEKERVHQTESGSPAPALHKRGLNFAFCSFHFSFFILPVIDRLLVREYLLCYNRSPRILDRPPAPLAPPSELDSRRLTRYVSILPP